MSIKRVLSCSAAFVAVMFLASMAFAQGSQPDLVGQMDKDGDGKITKSEWTGAPKAFSTYDKNGDGAIASDEKPSGMPTLDLMDKNGDGKISKDEFPGDATEGMFDQFDADKDGYLSETEVSSPPGGSGGGQGGGAAPSGAGGGQGGAAPGGAAPAQK